MIILGLYLSLLILAAGTVLMFINRTLIGYNPYYDYISQLGGKEFCYSQKL